MYGKRKDSAEQARSAFAEDRLCGAGAGRLFGRLLSPTAIIPRGALSIVLKAAGRRGDLGEGEILLVVRCFG